MEVGKQSPDDLGWLKKISGKLIITFLNFELIRK